MKGQGGQGRQGGQGGMTLLIDNPFIWIVNHVY